jgi:hypothetical protein
MADIQSMDDYKVIIDGQSYNLLQVPPANSPVVNAQRESILAGLKLDDVITGLERARGLLWCAYNGVAGFAPLRVQVLTRQDELAELCRKSFDSLASFDRISQDVLKNMSQVFKNLVIPAQLPIALGFLKSCASGAQRLADKAHELATDFDKLASSTFKTCCDTQLQEGLTEQQKLDFEQKSKEMQAQVARAQTASTEYDKLSKDYQKKYEDAHADAEKESDRAFTIALTSAIVKPLAAGLGAFAQMYTASKNPAAAVAVALDSNRQKGKPEEGAAEEPKEDDAAETSPDKGPSDAKKAAAAGAAEAAKETAKTIGETADKQADAANSARERELVILKAQQQIEMARVEQMSQLAQYAVELKNLEAQVGVSKTTVMSLHIASGALKAVVVSLRNAAMFWDHMKIFLERLNDPDVGLQADIKRAKDWDLSLQVDYFKTDDDFKTDVVTHYAGWLAISLIAKEYAKQAVAVRDKVYANVKSNPTTEDSIPLARQLGEQLFLETQADLTSAKANAAKIDDQLEKNRAA